MYAFYDYFHHEKFLNIPVSLASELHNYSTRSASSNQVAIPLLRTNLRRFCPALLEVSFGTIFCNPLETNHLKKCLEKHFCAGNLLNTNETLSLLLFFFLFCHFFYFLLKISSPLLYITLRGTILVYLDVTLSSRSIYNVIQFKCCSFCSTHFFLCKSLSDTMLYHVIFT